jgi:hypothetical protein
MFKIVVVVAADFYVQLGFSLSICLINAAFEDDHAVFDCASEQAKEKKKERKREREEKYCKFIRECK